jgi:hypothetical protein
LTEQLADDFAGIFAAAEVFHLLQNPAECRLRLLDRDLGVVLAVRFETLVMFLKLFAEEIGKTLARRTV